MSRRPENRTQAITLLERLEQRERTTASAAVLHRVLAERDRRHARQSRHRAASVPGARRSGQGNHQPHGGARGQASDIEIQAREIRHTKDVLANILVKATGRTSERIHKDIDRDFFLGAEAAKEYGVIDNVMVSPKTKKA